MFFGVNLLDSKLHSKLHFKLYFSGGIHRTNDDTYLAVIRRQHELLQKTKETKTISLRNRTDPPACKGLSRSMPNGKVGGGVPHFPLLKTNFRSF